VETVLQVLEKEPTRPRVLNPAVPRDLEMICLKCLHKEPGRRFGTALALAEDLERWLQGEPIRARPVRAGERLLYWVRRRPGAARRGEGARRGRGAAALTLVSAGAALAVGARVGGLSANARLQAVYKEGSAQRARADEKEGNARRYLYLAHVNLAQQAWQETR